MTPIATRVRVRTVTGVLLVAFAAADLPAQRDAIWVEGAVLEAPVDAASDHRPCVSADDHEVRR